MTKVERTCPRCGLVFISEKLDGLCPGCLLTNTLDLVGGDDATAFWEDEPAATTLGRSFSHFEIIEELGRGGMGTVYKARDHVTERIVALKVLQAHHLSEPDLVQRFRSEVRAISSLDHRHILPIHEVGENDGIPFFSMKLASAGSLAQHLGDYLGHARRAAILLVKVARGVQHAHERGILHRDLKPGNILLDDAGEPYVCDFGLAKWLEDDRRMTITSAVLGTPHYIAPEQASGKQGLTIAADIYSLGAILYELLTGRPPFVGDTVIDTLRQASENTPAKPSSIVNQTPRDLETICLKALEREPTARYATAAAFADDLDNWIAGRPIRARPVSAAEQLWRWARRNPLPAILGVTLVLALVALAIGATIAAVKIDRSRTRAVAAEQDAREQLYSSLLAQARASRMTGQAGHRIEALAALKKAASIHPSLEARNEAIAALTLVDLEVIKKIKVRETSKQPIAFDRSFETVSVAADNGDINVVSLKDGSIQRVITGNGKPILWLIHSGTHYLASRSDNGVLYLRDFATGALLREHEGHPIPHLLRDYAMDCIFSPDETIFALGSPEGIEIVEVATGRKIARLKTAQPDFLAFDPKGKRLAFGNSKERKIEIWSYADKESAKVIFLPSEPTAIAWSYDDTKLAIGCSNSSIQVIDTRDWETIGSLASHSLAISEVVFNHRGDQLASTAPDSTIRLWDLRTMIELVELPKHGSNPIIRFSSDDRFFSATDSQRSAVIIEVISSSQVCAAFAPTFPREQLTLSDSTTDYSPNSLLLATGSTKALQLFDAKKGHLLLTLPISPATPTTVRFLADGKTLVALQHGSGLTFYQYAFRDGKLEITETKNTGQFSGYIFGSLTNNSTAPLSLFSTLEPKGVVMDSSCEKVVCTLEASSIINDLVVSPDKKWIVSGHRTQNAQIWSFPSGEHVAELEGGRAGAFAFSPSGRWLGCSGSGADHVLWNSGRWTRGPSLPPQIEEKTSFFAFSHDERFLAASMVEQVALVSLPDGKFLGLLEQHLQPTTYNHLRFSPDGSILATQGADNSLALWNLPELQKALCELNLQW